MKSHTQTQFITNGLKTKIVAVDSSSPQLAVGNYAVDYNQFEGFFLVEREAFVLPTKLYGETTFPERILNTYAKMGKGMGVLLSGPKGTGKTIEAKQTCIKAEMPIILIANAFSGSSFQEFIESIKTPSVIFIDEFEKVYEEETDRNFFLSIMDGVAKSRHLFLLTSNSAGIGEYFSSRPGRVRYHKTYEYLSDEMIELIVNDRLKSKKHRSAVVKALSVISNMSIDSLTCILDECNMYNEIPRDFMSFFNVKTERPQHYSVEYTTRGPVPRKGLNTDQRRAAKEAIFNFNNYDERCDNFDDLVELKDIVYRDRFATPFNSYGYDDDDNTGYAPSISLEWLYDDDNNRHRLSWSSREIVEFKETRKGFTAVNRDGSVVTGTPASSRFMAM